LEFVKKLIGDFWLLRALSSAAAIQTFKINGILKVLRPFLIKPVSMKSPGLRLAMGLELWQNSQLCPKVSAAGEYEHKPTLFS